MTIGIYEDILERFNDIYLSHIYYYLERRYEKLQMYDKARGFIGRQ